MKCGCRWDLPQVSADASIDSQHASPTVEPADNGRERVPISYVGGPLNGLAVDSLAHTHRHETLDGHYRFDDECLVMRWEASSE